MTDHLDAAGEGHRLLALAMARPRDRKSEKPTKYAEVLWLDRRDRETKTFCMEHAPIPAPGIVVHYRTVAGSRETAEDEGVTCETCDLELVPPVCLEAPEGLRYALQSGCFERVDACICAELAEVAASVKVCREGSAEYLA